MSGKVVIYRENASSHEEEYLARADKNTFVSVENPARITRHRGIK